MAVQIVSVSLDVVLMLSVKLIFVHLTVIAVIQNGIIFVPVTQLINVQENIQIVIIGIMAGIGIIGMIIGVMPAGIPIVIQI